LVCHSNPCVGMTARGSASSAAPTSTMIPAIATGRSRPSMGGLAQP
jgi:hypothetical protein